MSPDLYKPLLGAGIFLFLTTTPSAGRAARALKHEPQLSVSCEPDSTRESPASIVNISYSAWLSDVWDSDYIDSVEITGDPDDYYDYSTGSGWSASGTFQDDSRDPYPDTILYDVYVTAYAGEYEGYIDNDDYGYTFPGSPIPSQMRLSGSVNSTRDCAYCAQYNWLTQRTYQLQDQWNNDYSGPQMTLDESFDLDDSACPFDLTTHSAVTASDGTWPDSFWFCHTHCCSGTCQDTATQTWSLDSNGATIGTLYVTWYCDHVGIIGP